MWYLEYMDLDTNVVNRIYYENKNLLDQDLSNYWIYQKSFKVLLYGVIK